MKLLGSQSETGCTCRHGDHVAKKSLLGIGLGYYPKLELHFSLFWHQNGLVITLRISKNMLPKLGDCCPKQHDNFNFEDDFVQRIELHLH